MLRLSCVKLFTAEELRLAVSRPIPYCGIHLNLNCVDDPSETFFPVEPVQVKSTRPRNKRNRMVYRCETSVEIYLIS